MYWRAICWLLCWLDSLLSKIYDRFRRKIFELYWLRELFLAYKFCIHWMTGMSELHRHLLLTSTYNSYPSAMIVGKVADILQYSKVLAKEMENYVKIESVNFLTKRVAQIKSIPIKSHSYKRLHQCLDRIIKAKLVREECEELCKTCYDAAKHQTYLHKLWNMLIADGKGRAPPLIPDKAWRQLGFQGDNPETDFRGMGLYGLLQLL